jgi:hypothetical protein
MMFLIQRLKMRFQRIRPIDRVSHKTRPPFLVKVQLWAAEGTGTVCAKHPSGRCAANGASPLCQEKLAVPDVFRHFTRVFESVRMGASRLASICRVLKVFLLPVHRVVGLKHERSLVMPYLSMLIGAACISTF